MIHLYTGEGKGKTTASLGLLLRAYGQGKRVVLVQFLKGCDTGELYALKRMPGVVVLRNAQEYDFYSSASQVDREKIKSQNNNNLKEVFRLVDEGRCDLLVLDEVCSAYENSALDRTLVDRLISEKAFGLELVLTGRNAPEHFIRAADYVTECVKHKHPFDLGVKAREGVEF